MWEGWGVIKDRKMSDKINVVCEEHKKESVL